MRETPARIERQSSFMALCKSSDLLAHFNGDQQGRRYRWKYYCFLRSPSNSLSSIRIARNLPPAAAKTENTKITVTGSRPISKYIDSCESNPRIPVFPIAPLTKGVRNNAAQRRAGQIVFRPARK